MFRYVSCTGSLQDTCMCKIILNFIWLNSKLKHLIKVNDFHKFGETLISTIRKCYMMCHMMCHMNTFFNITCSFVNYSLQQTQEFLKSETFPDTDLHDKVHVYVIYQMIKEGRE